MSTPFAFQNREVAFAPLRGAVLVAQIRKAAKSPFAAPPAPDAPEASGALVILRSWKQALAPLAIALPFANDVAAHAARADKTAWDWLVLAGGAVVAVALAYALFCYARNPERAASLSSTATELRCSGRSEPRCPGRRSPDARSKADSAARGCG